MSDVVTLKVDGQEVTVPAGSTIMDACHALNIEIPHFCYHKRLSIAGNCRMCLVEVEPGPPKPAASCAMPAMEGMNVKTNSEMAVDARKGTMEFLLANHPLDCPICDQGGECDLQDMAVGYGSDRSRFTEGKRAVEDKDIGPLIKTVMTRCIHCMRCVRFATEIAGIEEFGATGRGENVKVGTYVEKALKSELSGNIIDLCPVGALTSKPYAFTARPWELERTASIDVMDAVGSNIWVDSRDGEIMRITPKENDAVNEEWLSNTGRFSYDGLSRRRLTNPQLRKGKKLEDITWQEAFKTIKSKVARADKDKISGLSGGLHSAEDLYAFRRFMKEVLGTDNVDGRLPHVSLEGERGGYIMNTPLKEIEDADAVLLIGCDPRFEAPLLNVRLRQLVQNNNVPIAVIGDAVDLTYDVTHLSNTPQGLEKLLDGTEKWAQKLTKAKKPLVIVGAKAALSRTDGDCVLGTVGKIVKQFDVITSDWNGFNILHQKPGHIAALDMAVHPTGKGMDSAKIQEKLSKKEMDILFLYGENDVPMKDLKGAKFTVYLGTHHDADAEIADLILPTAAYTEKEGWWVNIEGRVQAGHKAVNPPEQAKEDWKIFRALSEEMGKKLNFDSLKQLREHIAEGHHLAYRHVSELLPNAMPKKLGVTGQMKSAAFVCPVPSFYQANEILRASEVMLECLNVDQETIKKAS
jgi:NADH-quinone oxidoreductase subunit G